MEEGVVCVIFFQVKNASLALSECVMPIRSFQTLSTLLQAQRWTAARYLGTIFLAGLCQQHKHYPRVYIWYNHTRQTTATCRNMESNIKINYMYCIQSAVMCGL